MKRISFLRIAAAIAITLFIASCVSFEEQSSSLDDEITAFGEVYLEGRLTLDMLQNLGQVTATRTVTYTLEQNGDFTVEMGDYTFTYNAAENESVETGTRVIGHLKFTEAPKPAAPAGIGGDGGLLGGLNPLAAFGSDDGGQEPKESAGAAARGPRGIALDAVNYDLLQEAAAAGGIALLLPEYSWSVEETISGTDMNLPLLGPSRTIQTRQVVYTVTARAAAVSF